MTRLVILLLLVVGGVWWASTRLARARQRDRAPAPKRGSAARQVAVTGMVRCAHCGVHLPEHDAIAEGELHFCGEAHRRLGHR